VSLNVTVFTPTRRLRETRVMLAHGFMQNSHCWGTLGERLATVLPTAAVDLPGHGASAHDDADLTTAGNLLAATAAGSVLVGYSMGGRMALHAALRSQHELEALVLIGASAGIIDASERLARAKLDNQRAHELTEDFEGFVDQWLSNPLFAKLPVDAQFRSERLSNRPEGLAESLRRCGTGQQEPLHDRLQQISIPVLLMVGDNDHKFQHEAEMMQARIGPNATTTLIRSAGHACHLEQPEMTLASILEWIDFHQTR